MAVDNRTTATRLAHREFSLDCPKLDEQARAKSAAVTLTGMEELRAAQRRLTALARRSGIAELEAIATALRQAEANLALGLFNERPGRQSH